MNSLLRFIWYVLLVRPVVYLLLGINVRNRSKLLVEGPAIIAANHNSHLDTMVLVSIFPVGYLDRLRPVAAADYFLRNKLIAWFSLKIIGIIPLERKVKRSGGDPLAGCTDALERGEVLLLFPEGSRGEPEELAGFKNGIAHLARRHPEVPVIPVFTHGLGKSLPRGEGLFVPFFIDIFVGDPLYYESDRGSFMEVYEKSMENLKEEGLFAEWE